MTSEINTMLGGHTQEHDHCFCLFDPIFPPKVKCCKCGESRGVNVSATRRDTIPLPVQPQDQSRLDEKYPLRGHASIDARFGTDWNQQEE